MTGGFRSITSLILIGLLLVKLSVESLLFSCSVDVVYKSFVLPMQGTCGVCSKSVNLFI